MRNITKTMIAAGVLLGLGGAGFATYATAEARGGGHGRHHGHHGPAGGGGLTMLMERFDADKDGKLTQGELDESRKSLLARHDADKDGKLSLAEFEGLWLEFMRKRMVRGFQRLDEDGDAAVTTDEFLKPYAKVLERMDRNDDGVLDAEDRRRRRHHGPDGERRHDDEDRRGGDRG